MSLDARPPHGRDLARWLIRPAQGWQHKTRGMVRNRMFMLLGAIGVVFLASLAVAVWQLLRGPGPTAVGLIQVALLTLGLIVTASLPVLIYRQLFTPLFHVRHWAQRVRGGNLAARIPQPRDGEFAELAGDINALTEQLQRLTREMRDEVRAQTERLEQKSHTLKVLYDVAASINTSRDLEDLLTRFLTSVKQIVGARAATARLVTPDGQMRLVANLGFHPDDRHCHQILPLGRCLCGQVADGEEMSTHTEVHRCGRVETDSLEAADNPAMIAVPLQHRGQTLGVYSLFLEEGAEPLSDDMENLLTSIGRHLGMAIEKARLDEEAQRLGIIEERTHIAHELHDSLAQTLASLRFRVGALEETASRAAQEELQREINVVREGLQQANTELRELISHFRAPPVTHQGLVCGVEKLVERFREDTGVRVYLQKEWQAGELPAELESEVLRIVQEALCNIGKHAAAQHVRVLLRAAPPGEYLVMVEDDGCGIRQRTEPGARGEHIGLSVMEERAARLEADFRIESEPGEGTRMTLRFQYPRQQSVDFQPRMRALS